MNKYIKVKEAVTWPDGFAETWINTQNITTVRLTMQEPQHCEVHLGGNRYVTVVEPIEQLIARLEGVNKCNHRFPHRIHPDGWQCEMCGEVITSPEQLK
jgi:hypothetical protein